MRFAAVLLLALTSSVFAGDFTASEEKLLKATYPNATFEVKGTRQINAVTVHDVQVKLSDASSCSATTTDTGEFILWSYPKKSRTMSEPVKRVAQGLFNKEPEDASPYVINTYAVLMKNQGKSYWVTLDPVGRLLDLASSDEVKAEQSARTKADAQYTKPVKPADLPEVVQKSIKELFATAQFTEAKRITEPYWRFEHRIGDNVLTLKVREDGIILQVNSREAVLPARQPTPPPAAPKKK